MVDRGRLVIAALLAATLWTASGCSCRLLELASEPASATSRAKSTIPAQAWLSTDATRAWADGSTEFYRPDPRYDPTRLQSLLRESKLFDGLSSTPAGVIGLAFSARLLVPLGGGREFLRALRALGTLSGIGLPFDLIYLRSDPPFSMASTLEVRAQDGELVAKYETKATLEVENQFFARPHDVETEAFDRLAAATEKVLVGKLVADESLAGEIERRMRRPAVVARPPLAKIAPAAPVTPARRAPAATTADVAQLGNTYVLIVGVNEYQDARIPKLRYAEPDAQAIYAFFATEKKSPTAADRVQVILGKDATRIAVLKAIRDHLAVKATGEDDLAILFFAGHGFADAKETYLACADSQLDLLPETSIPASVLRSYWAEIRAGRKLLLTDACHSGGLENMRGIGGVMVAPDAEARETSISVMISASGPNELSVEDPRAGHGVFTQALLNGLHGDATARGPVTLRDLATFLEKEVPSLAARARGKQTPVVRGLEARGERIPLTR